MKSNETGTNMRIMILVPSFGKASPVEGAFLFAKYLHEHGKDVIFVSLDDNYHSKMSIIDEIVRAGIDYECLNIKGWWGLWYYSYVQEYCRKKGIDVVIAYELRPTLIASTLSKVVKIASVRGILREAYPLYYPYGRLVSNIFTTIQMRSLRRMDHVFSMSSVMTKWLISEGVKSSRISIVNNFVDVKLISNFVDPIKRNNRTHYNIGIFSTINPLKRIDVALRSFGEVIHDYHLKNVSFHIVGSGTILEKIKKLSTELGLDNWIVFHGFIEKPFPLMAEMDIILLTSESEGVPRCLMEALSMGKTVIASNIPGINKLVLDGLTGYLFPVGDFRVLAELITRILENNLFLQSTFLTDYMLKSHDVNICGKAMTDRIERVYSGKSTFTHNSNTLLSERSIIVQR